MDGKSAKSAALVSPVSSSTVTSGSIPFKTDVGIPLDRAVLGGMSGYREESLKRLGWSAVLLISRDTPFPTGGLGLDAEVRRHSAHALSIGRRHRRV